MTLLCHGLTFQAISRIHQMQGIVATLGSIRIEDTGEHVPASWLSHKGEASNVHVGDSNGHPAPVEVVRLVEAFAARCETALWRSSAQTEAEALALIQEMQ